MSSSASDAGRDDRKPRTVGLVYSEAHMKTCDTMPRIQGRCKLVHGLIQAYGINRSLALISPERASRSELCEFHSSLYVESLQEDKSCEEDDDAERDEMFGFGYDCPVFDGVYEYVEAVAGGTLAAVSALCSEACSVACHWEGGWHHCHRDQASGFCYVNDIVLAILRLRDAGFRRILYIDLDVHHGDGVEGAFSHSADVMTVSFHRYCPGFFPGTGATGDCGSGKGRFHCLNIPLGDGTRDGTFLRVFSRVMAEVHDRFRPDAVVCQCGADCLAGDPLGAFNLTPASLCACVEQLTAWQIPLLVLGGGGYNLANTARCWTQITASLVGMRCHDDIPEHGNFAKFGPDFTMNVSPGNRREELTTTEVDRLISTVLGHLSNIEPPTPASESAQDLHEKEDAAIAAKLAAST
ncbi:histone deacetylase 8-like [Sycon ciliatum]|uniref:histone deacetylase 8-like n=1 Tax=Sycon ciliatum TaxID=27933 RepID=UPI0031F6F836